MHNLSPTSALGASAPRADEIGTIQMSENFGLALASVSARHGQEARCADELSTYIGATAPGPARAVIGEPFAAFWTGLDQWMVSAPFETHELLADDLKASLQDAASVTEQTDGWVVFDVTGAGVVDLFERLCPAPARRMVAGDGQRTTIHHIGCFLNCHAEAQGFQVLGPRSSAGTLHHALMTVARAVV